MELHGFLASITLKDILEIFDKYKSMGPLLGIGLPLLESFLPFLPLVLFVVANVNSFGLLLGFLFSWVGACAGSILVFLIVRKYGQKRLFAFLRKHKSIQKMLSWFEHHGFGPIFLLLCFPFTPSAAVNVVAGLSKISGLNFILASLLGKLVMVFIVSYAGQDLQSLVRKPGKLVVVLAVLAVMWIVGKIVEKRMKAKRLESEE